ETYDFFSLPLFVRPNSFLALGANDLRPDYDYADGVELQLHNLEDGRTAETIVRDLKGVSELTISAVRSGNSISFKVKSSGKPFSVSLKGIGAIASVEGASAEVDGTVARFAAGAAEASFVITIQ
ncbi:alpha-xylosidase, partial [Paenibacillus sp. MCAF20]